MPEHTDDDTVVLADNVIVPASLIEFVPTTQHLFEFFVAGTIDNHAITNTFYAVCMDQSGTPVGGQPHLGTMCLAWADLYRTHLMPLAPTDYRVEFYRLKNIYDAELYTPLGSAESEQRLRLKYGEVYELPHDALKDVGTNVGPRLPTYTACHVTTKSVFSSREWIGGLRTFPLLEADVDDDRVKAGVLALLEAAYGGFLTTLFQHNALAGQAIPVHFSRKYAAAHLDDIPGSWGTSYITIRGEPIYSHQITRRINDTPD